MQFCCRVLSPATFADFVRLFTPSKGCNGCWCMWFRLGSREWQSLKGDGCRDAMHHLVQRGEAYGLLAYAGDEPVGWCTFGPREHFPRLDRTRAYQGLDKPPGLWSLPCFYIARGWRGKGLARFMLAQAEAQAAEQGARVIEAYPVTTTRDGRRVQAEFAWAGPLGIYLDAGFKIVHRANEWRPVVRKEPAP